MAKTLLLVFASVLLACTFFFSSVNPTEATSLPAHAKAADCFSSYQHFQADWDRWKQTTRVSTTFRTSARCKDINLQFNALAYAVLVSASTCSGHFLGSAIARPYQGWIVIASAPDNVCFRLEITRSTQRNTPYTVSGFVAA